MQTFLPHADFELSARSLDQKRLGKQRVECIQVVRGLTWEKYGWKNHPAVKMWRGYEEALGRYSLVCCEVWLELGFADTCAATILADLAKVGITEIRTQSELDAAGELPPWLGDEQFHVSHQSSLVRKDPDFYGPRFPGVPDDLPYHWPTQVQEAQERAAAEAAEAAEAGEAGEAGEAAEAAEAAQGVPDAGVEAASPTG